MICVIGVPLFFMSIRDAFPGHAASRILISCPHLPLPWPVMFGGLAKIGIKNVSSDNTPSSDGLSLIHEYEITFDALGMTNGCKDCMAEPEKIQKR